MREAEAIISDFLASGWSSMPYERMILFYEHDDLDSDLPTEDGREWHWGSGGICYVFWCNACRISATTWQCT
jgi:hypothetical protein